MAFVTVVGTASGRHRVSRYRTKPQMFCDVPDRDYIHGGPSLPGLAMSTTALLVLVPGSVPPDVLPSGRRMVYYQLKQNEVRVEHCSISRVSLAIRDDGYWTLSLRADQNQQMFTKTPLIAAGQPVPGAQTTVPRPSPILPAQRQQPSLRNTSSATCSSSRYVPTRGLSLIPLLTACRADRYCFRCSPIHSGSREESRCSPSLKGRSPRSLHFSRPSTASRLSCRTADRRWIRRSGKQENESRGQRRRTCYETHGSDRSVSAGSARRP